MMTLLVCVSLNEQYHIVFQANGCVERKQNICLMDV